MACYFISDIHLGLGNHDEEKRKEDRLLEFLRSIRPDAAEIFLMGDLFDFWFEYRTVIPKGFHRTLSALQEFTDRGIPIDYLLGNHDFWVGDFFRSELGINVHREPYESDIGGKRLFLHHGDGLATNDLGYKMIKPILRHPLSIRAYRWLHPDWGVPLARGSSRTSRAYTAEKDYGEDEGMLGFAQSCIARGIDIVVMGHRHKPAFVPVNGGVYINLGDWISFSTYGELSGGIMKLNTWNGKKA